MTELPDDGRESTTDHGTQFVTFAVGAEQYDIMAAGLWQQGQASTRRSAGGAAGEIQLTLKSGNIAKPDSAP